MKTQKGTTVGKEEGGFLLYSPVMTSRICSLGGRKVLAHLLLKKIEKKEQGTGLVLEL